MIPHKEKCHAQRNRNNDFLFNHTFLSIYEMCILDWYPVYLLPLRLSSDLKLIVEMLLNWTTFDLIKYYFLFRTYGTYYKQLCYIERLIKQSAAPEDVLSTRFTHHRSQCGF